MTTTQEEIMKNNAPGYPSAEEAKPRQLKRVAVYCGSSSGNDPKFIEAATALGTFLAKNDIEIIYGGGGSGMMGELAKSSLANGGKVHGWIPHFLTPFGLDNGLTSLTKTEGLYDRKLAMLDAADAFICLAGGPGTLDEFAEVFCWAYLTIHHKPIGLVNVNHYWNCLDGMFDKFVTSGFAPASIYKLFHRDADIPSLWNKMINHQGPTSVHFHNMKTLASLKAKRAEANVHEGYSVIGKPCTATSAEEVKETFGQTGQQVIKKVAVFLGSSAPSNPIYMQTATKVGKFLAAKGVDVVYGAGNYGCMGAMAIAFLDGGGKMHGVVPYWMPLTKEGGYLEPALDRLTSLQRVDDMHTRKKTMFEMVDAFIVLPGGPGSLDELCDVFTAASLSVHAKPIGLVDVDSYWSTFPPILKSFASHGFMKESVLQILNLDSDIGNLWSKMKSYVPPPPRFDSNPQLPAPANPKITSSFKFNADIQQTNGFIPLSFAIASVICFYRCCRRWCLPCYRRDATFVKHFNVLSSKSKVQMITNLN